MWKVIGLQSVFAERVPGMHKNGKAKFRRRFQDFNDGRIVQIAAHDVGPDLGRLKAHRRNAFKFLDGEFRSLQGYGASRQEPLRVFGYALRDEIILYPRELSGRFRRAPITKEDRDRRQKLPMDALYVHVGDPPRRDKALVRDLTKFAVAKHDAGGAGRMLLYPGPAGDTKS